MRRGFELLTTRQIKGSIDIGKIEAEYSVKLPPLYRIFVETFVLGEDLIKSDKYISSNGSLFHASYFIYEINKEVMFGGFNDLDKTLSLKDEDEKWSSNGYLPIGYCGFNGGIVLGTEGDKADKVILHDFDGEMEFTHLANNIFEFVRGLVLEPVDENHLKGDVKFEQLYRNWGENFWRVREQ